MSFKSRKRNDKTNNAHRAIIRSSITLGLVVAFLFLSLSLMRSVNASALEQGTEQDESPIIGLASEPLQCLSVGEGASSDASGNVNLNWFGTPQRARLIMNVAGAEAAHTIILNGQPLAQVPIYAEGQLCGEGSVFYLDVPLDLIVNGNNQIEITNDSLSSDTWSATNVRLEVLGNFAITVPGGVRVGNRKSLSATAMHAFTFSFTNLYDNPNSTQEARAQIPISYTGALAPLLVTIHGRNGDMFFGENNFGAEIENRGWLLVSPQLHGAWDINPPVGRYAYASLESQYDVIGSVRYMIETFNVDPDRIYIVGYSMGAQVGSVTMAKFPHTFAAFFDNKGPSDMFKWYDDPSTSGGHQGHMSDECHIGGVGKTPNENPFCYQRRSGINFASNYVHIPLSITHSISDVLVAIYHSYDFRDAINGYGPDLSASIYEENDLMGGNGGEPNFHSFKPEADDVMDYLEPFTLNNNPTYINITTDESKTFHWMNVAQTGGDHWSQIEVTVHALTTSVSVSISDGSSLSLGFNLGSTSMPVLSSLNQPGMGLSATTYLVKGGGANNLYDYTSGFLTTTLSATGQYTLTISAIDVLVSANPTSILGNGITTSMITAEIRDQLGNPVPDGTSMQFSTTIGKFPNGNSTYNTTTSGGIASATLTSAQTSGFAQVVASVLSVSDSTSVEMTNAEIIYLPLITRERLVP